jgi:hypothetical protein
MTACLEPARRLPRTMTELSTLGEPVMSPCSELVIVVVLVIGAALFNSQDAGATRRPELAKLAQITNAMHPVAALAGRPTRLEQQPALNDDTVPSALKHGPGICIAIRVSGDPEERLGA